MPVTNKELNKFIERNNLMNQIICFHSPDSAFDEFEGDIAEFCDTFLSHGCTLMAPSYSWKYAVYPANGQLTVQNKWDYEQVQDSGFTPESLSADNDIGILSAFLLSHPERVRSNNPIGSLVAVGPFAEELLRQTHSYSTPFERLKRVNGKILLWDVDCSHMSYIQFVKEVCDLPMAYRWVKDGNDKDRWVYGAACDRNNETLAPLLEPHLLTDQLGDSSVRIYPARDVFSVLKPYFRENGDTTMCETDCIICSDIKHRSFSVIDEDDYYQVVEGDTVWDIADKLDLPRKKIMEFCVDGYLYPGQWIPGKNAIDLSDYYRVKEGDSVWSIAEEFDIPLEVILEQCESETIYVGQWIHIAEECHSLVD